jgi:hypothetical protein
LELLTIKRLKHICEELGIEKRGNKNELVNIIMDNNIHTIDELIDKIDWLNFLEELTLKELQQICVMLSCAISGTKQKIIDRILNQNIYLIGEITCEINKNRNKKYLLKCNNCNHVFYTNAKSNRNLLCQKCDSFLDKFDNEFYKLYKSDPDFYDDIIEI